MYTTSYHTEDLSNYTFLVTGGAGFIGSNLVEYLLQHNAKKVRVLDNLSTGYLSNIEAFTVYNNLEIIVDDICDSNACKTAVEGIDFVLHQAALGSVPRSIQDPLTTNQTNITGFLTLLNAVRQSKVKRLVYASSSSVYGDSEELPKREEKIGKPLSPYAVTKLTNEIYADVFSKTYKIETVGLRYFNVFGPKQDPQSAYAAVIPLFLKAIKEGEQPTIYGDGEQTRDFTFIENVVQANIKALFSTQTAKAQVYNVACNDRISINQLWNTIRKASYSSLKAIHKGDRAGDIKHSLADISRIKNTLNYSPMIDVKQGITRTVNWFQNQNTENT